MNVAALHGRVIAWLLFDAYLFALNAANSSSVHPSRDCRWQQYIGSEGGMSTLVRYCVGSGSLGSDRVELCYGVRWVCMYVCVCVCVYIRSEDGMLCCGCGDVVVVCGSVSL